MPKSIKTHIDPAQYIAALEAGVVEQSAVERLYNAASNRSRIVHELEAKLYPRDPRPPRTAQHVKEHVKSMTDDFNARKMRNLRKIEEEMYEPAWIKERQPSPKRPSDVAKRNHDDVMRRLTKHRETLAQRSLNAPPPAKPLAVVKREKGFRSAVHSPPRQDHKALLCCEAAAPKTTTARRSRSSSAGGSGGRLRPDAEKHLAKLAEPRVVHEKVDVTKHDKDFCVYTKYGRGN